MNVPLLTNDKENMIQHKHNRKMLFSVFVWMDKTILIIEINVLETNTLQIIQQL